VPASIDVRCGSSASEIVVRVTGEIDMAAVPVVSAALEPHLERAVPGTKLSVDLSGVTFMSLHGVNLLLEAADSARSRGAALRVVGCPPRLMRLLVLTGMDAALT
jgi:anti-sigma B factor antagonist